MRKDISWVDLVCLTIPLVFVIIMLVAVSTPIHKPMEPLPPLVAEIYKYEIVCDEPIAVLSVGKNLN